jgi:hypothetical protein
VYTDPTGPGPHPAYQNRQDYGPQDLLPFSLDGVILGHVPVQDILP